MAPRRSSTRRGRTSRANTRGPKGGIQKHTHSRHAATRYRQQQDPALTATRESEGTNDPRSASDEAQPSTPEYSHSPPSNTRTLSGSPTSQNTARSDWGNYISTSAQANRTQSISPLERSINLTTMRERLHSHEQEIVNRVVLQLGMQNHSHPTTTPPEVPPIHHQVPGTQQIQANPTLTRIAESEAQLAKL